MAYTNMPATGTLAQRLLPQRGWLAQGLLRDGLLVMAGSLFVALCAHVSIPLPFTPVPLSGQTLGVLLTGALLGPRLGALALLLYLVEGAIGLPFYAGGGSGWEVLRGATAGYLAGFVLAAALVGWLAARGWDRRVGSTVLMMALGNLVIYALGVGWLAYGVGLGLGDALAKGLLPFLLGDALKIALAAGVLPAGWRLLGR
jgi:biotin transport system substrate-specific component